MPIRLVLLWVDVGILGGVVAFLVWRLARRVNLARRARRAREDQTVRRAWEPPAGVIDHRPWRDQLIERLDAMAEEARRATEIVDRAVEEERARIRGEQEVGGGDLG